MKTKKIYLDSDELEWTKKLAELHYKIQNGGLSENQYETYKDLKEALKNVLPIAS